MKVGIVGSSSRKKVKDEVCKLVESFPEGTILVSGGSKGVDLWAAEAARERGIPVMEYLPYKPPEDASPRDALRAAKSRNKKIVETSDKLYIFVSEERNDDIENLVSCAEKLSVPMEIK